MEREATNEVELEREIRLMLAHAAGDDGDRMYEQLRRVADPQTLVAYLRDLTLPSQTELCTLLAQSMLEGLGKREDQVSRLSEMLETHHAQPDARLMLDAQIGGLVRTLHACLRDGESVEGVIAAGKNMIVQGGRLVEIPWSGDIACDLCTGKVPIGASIWYCAVSLKWQGADGTVEDRGGLALCAECRTFAHERDNLTFPEYVLLVSRRLARGI